MKKMYAVSLDPEVVVKVREWCNATGVTFSALVRMLLAEFAGAAENQPGGGKDLREMTLAEFGAAMKYWLELVGGDLVDIPAPGAPASRRAPGAGKSGG